MDGIKQHTSDKAHEKHIFSAVEINKEEKP